MKLSTPLLQKLQDIGLSEAESRLYLVGLELGPTTILKLSKISEIKRTSIYNMIDSLVLKGVFEIQIYGWKKLYVASSPQSLQKVIYKNYQNLLSIIPSLENISTKAQEDMYLKTYTGEKSIGNLYLAILSKLEENTEYLIIGNMKLWVDAMGEFAPSFFAERQKICKAKNVKIKALFIDDQYSQIQKSTDKLFGMEVKYLPAGSNINTNYVITSNTAVFHQTININEAFETNNPYIIETQKELFALLWGNQL
jgi:sugar-specific transcriptional regulator TrmB